MDWFLHYVNTLADSLWLKPIDIKDVNNYLSGYILLGVFSFFYYFVNDAYFLTSFSLISSFFFYSYFNNFIGGLILSAYLRQFFNILKMCGLVKSESLISSTYFLYWLISVYLINPREIIVSISLNGIDDTFNILILLISFNKHATKFDVLLTLIICELNLING